MATITHYLDAESGQFLSSTFPQPTKNGSNFPALGLAYDAAADEAAFWRFEAVNYGSGNLTLTLWWYADTATSGVARWGGVLAAITPTADTQDVETKALATEATVDATHLGTVGQRLHQHTITISSLDSLAAGDVVWLRIRRIGSHANDTMTGDAILIGAKVAYSDV